MNAPKRARVILTNNALYWALSGIWGGAPRTVKEDEEDAGVGSGRFGVFLLALPGERR